MKILVVDDHPVVIAGLRVLFAGDKQIKLSSAADHREGLSSYRSQHPDVAIIDINLPSVSGFDLLRRIVDEDPAGKVVIFSMNDDPAFAVRAFELGAKAYISKNDDPNLLLKAVREVADGSNFVTPQMAKKMAFSGAAIRANPAQQLNARELEVLRLLAQGRKIAEVAKALDISYKTVANTTSLMKQKIGAKSHSDLIRIAVDMNLT